MKHFSNKLLTCEYMNHTYPIKKLNQWLHKTAVTVTAIVTLTVASASWAAPITLNYNGFANGGMNGKITKTSPAPTFTNQSVAAGQFDFNVISSPDLAKWNNTLQAFCIDVDNWLVTNTNVEYDIISANDIGGLTFQQHAQVGWLFDNHALNLGSSGQFDAAFQLALWEIFFEENATLALNNGTFKSDNFGSSNGMTTRNLANSLLNGMGNGAISSDWEFYVLNPLNPSNNQRLITALPLGIPPAEISEPGTLILLIAGLGIVLLSIRRGTGTQLATRV
jgi:hypothetical protein